MPLALLQYKSGRGLEDLAKALSTALPSIVAPALDVKENKRARVQPEHVEVWVANSHPHDRNIRDLAIIVWANEYPERLANLDERRQQIQQAVRIFLHENSAYSLSGSVWVLLQPGSYGEF